MRALADDMAGLLGDHEGVLTSGHGLGIARSEAVERVLPPGAIALFKDLKAQLDPGFLLNPGKILRAPRFDDEALLRVTAESKNAENPAALSGALPAIEHARRCSGLGRGLRATESSPCRGARGSDSVALSAGQKAVGTRGTGLGEPKIRPVWTRPTDRWTFVAGRSNGTHHRSRGCSGGQQRRTLGNVCQQHVPSQESRRRRSASS